MTRLNLNREVLRQVAKSQRNRQQPKALPVPANLSYLPYQEEGILFASSRSSVLIADEMGLGKTIQALGFINVHWRRVETVLIVCPASLVINWQREIERWVVSTDITYTIASYASLKKISLEEVYDVAILDEAHYIKSPKAARTKLAYNIKCRQKIAMTGTPVLNKPIELWSILHWLAPKEWPNIHKFGIRYCAGHKKVIGSKIVKVQGQKQQVLKRAWDFTGSSNLDELREKLKSLMVRRLKVDVLKDLPSKVRQIIELPAMGVNPDLMKRLREASLKVEQLEETYINDVAKLDEEMELLFSETSALRHEAGLAKAEMAVEVIHNMLTSVDKIVVFAHHRDVIDELSTGLSKHKVECVVIHGGKTATQRQWAVDEFQNDPEVKVFIGQIQAAGTGLTLTASSHVVFVELDWTPGMMSQAEDRCHRIGQEDNVLVQHLVLEDSLDAKMAKTLVRKQAIVTRVLDAPRKEEEEIW
jgi:SWI/SNF-related matrix-associated actin-dependent regulator 1 of chromatin subfamily A